MLIALPLVAAAAFGAFALGGDTEDLIATVGNRILAFIVIVGLLGPLAVLAVGYVLRELHRAGFFAGYLKGVADLMDSFFGRAEKLLPFLGAL